METLSSACCEICHGKGIKSKVRTICKECRKFYCKACSDSHFLQKASRNHALIDLIHLIPPEGLDPPKANGDPSNGADLPSDFLDNLIGKENAVRYRTGVVGGARAQLQRDKRRRSSEQSISADKLNAKKCGEFSARRPGDYNDVDVAVVLAVVDKVIVSDDYNKRLRLFDQNGTFLSSVTLQSKVWGITKIEDDRVATVGLEKKISFWTLRDKKLVIGKASYDVDSSSVGVDYNGTYFALLRNWGNCINIMDAEGCEVRKIILNKAFGKKIEFGSVLHIDKVTHNIFIPCSGDNAGVLSVSVEGDPLWFTRLGGKPRGITELHDVLCVVDSSNRCLNLISKTGEIIKTLLGKKDLIHNPEYVSYSQATQKLYLTFDNNKDIISVYDLTA